MCVECVVSPCLSVLSSLHQTHKSKVPFDLSQHKLYLALSIIHILGDLYVSTGYGPKALPPFVFVFSTTLLSAVWYCLLFALFVNSTLLCVSSDSQMDHESEKLDIEVDDNTGSPAGVFFRPAAATESIRGLMQSPASPF
jgi:hypothetical protein